MSNEIIAIYAVALLQLGSTVYFAHRSSALRKADLFAAEVARLTREMDLLKANVRSVLRKLNMVDAMDR